MDRSAFLRSRRRLGPGFTLVEVMVGMVIGMIGMIVMMQIFITSDASKRSTSGGGDAQTNGVGAIHALQRDLRQSGYGLVSQALLGCSLALRSGVKLNTLAPLTINPTQVPAGDPATDTVLLAYASSAGSPEGDAIVSQPATNTYAVTAPLAFVPGDWIAVQKSLRPTPCALTLEKVQTATSSPPNLTVPVGVAGATGGSVFNFGPAPRFLAYAVRGGNLTVCDYMAADCSDAGQTADASVWSPLAAGIVSLRLQYGRDKNPVGMDGIVDDFDQLTPGSAADTSGLSINCSIARVLAARLVLVARSGPLEKTVVTTSAPTWAGSAGAPLDMSLLPGGAANLLWKNYRYKLFQGLVPLRSMAGLGVVSGC